jgi:hypothetical protein
MVKGPVNSVPPSIKTLMVYSYVVSLFSGYLFSRVQAVVRPFFLQTNGWRCASQPVSHLDQPFLVGGGFTLLIDCMTSSQNFCVANSDPIPRYPRIAASEPST